MNRRQAGFSVLEITVALTVLASGSSVLWYVLRSSARAEKLSRVHHAANQAARSDLESLRGMDRRDIRDTTYETPGPTGEILRVVRTVYDSARIVNTQQELILDDKLSPLELRKPLEVRVRVYPPHVEGEPLELPSPDEDPFRAPGEADVRPLTSLTLKLPDYRWY